MTTEERPNPVDLEAVRGEVKKVLAQSSAFLALPPDARRAFANDMVKVGAFLVKDPGWLESKQAPAVGLADAVDSIKQRLAQKPGQVGTDFKAGAVREGVSAFKDMVDTVDFPAFVSGLIQGVFQAIVDASIQQMRAYSDLLAATTKSLEQFANDTISDASARDHVRNTYPSMVQFTTADDGTKRLALADGVDDPSALGDIAGGATPDFSDPSTEQEYVNAAKLEMARGRQQTLALMVMLGINRIVVTNGKINAKVVFDMKADDSAKRRAEASLADNAESSSAGFATAALPWGAAGGYSSQSHKTTVQSSIDDSSDSKAQVKAQLAGDVTVNFKSDYLPMEKMISPDGINLITALAQPGRSVTAAPPQQVPPAAAPAPVAAAPAPAALPAPAPVATAPRPATTPAPAPAPAPTPAPTPVH